MIKILSYQNETSGFVNWIIERTDDHNERRIPGHGIHAGGRIQTESLLSDLTAICDDVTLSPFRILCSCSSLLSL